MSLSMVVALLQAALMLLTAAQAPNVPQSLRDQATQVANQAISQATAALASPQPLPQTNTPNNSANFSANPLSGTAPVVVEFSTAVEGADLDNVDFGDGSPLASLGGHCVSQGCGYGAQISHAYQSAGTYTAKLINPSFQCHGALNCNQNYVVGSVMITVTGATQPSAAINQSSLATGSPTPVITGTFSNVAGALTLVILSGNVSLPTNVIPDKTTPGTVFVDYTDHGGSLGKMPAGAASGTFVERYISSLTRGAYTVGLYMYQNIYTGAGYQGASTAHLLATGTLTVGSGTSQPSATIDQSSLVSTSANPFITGTAEGLSSVQIEISQIATASGDGPYPDWSGIANVNNGAWSFTPSQSNQMIGSQSGLSAGSYKVLVWMPNNNGTQPLITDTLTIQPSQQSGQ